MSPPIGCAHENALQVAIPGGRDPEGSLIENDHGSGVPGQSPGVHSSFVAHDKAVPFGWAAVDVREFQISFNFRP